MKDRLLHSSRLFLAALLLIGCNRDEDVHPNAHVNQWILKNMQAWYLWNSEIPENPDIRSDHEEFFKSLLVPSDRFSWIQEDYLELVNSLRGVNVESGYEFVLYRVNQTTTNLLGQVLYVKPNSPAALAGLKRGDLINGINHEILTVENNATLVPQIKEAHYLSYRSIHLEERSFGNTQTVYITPVAYAENPNYLHKVFTYDDHKVGYYVYNLFSSGANQGGTEYDAEMDGVFASFQAEGITDLIVDFRYNSGGSEAAATNLASLIGKGAGANDVFTRREYNQGLTDQIMNDPDLGEGFFSVHFLDKVQNVGSQLRNGRVYIITGPWTASASELVINGLLPYMDVFLIGSRTVGKNVGSVSLFDESDPDNRWGIQPIVTRALNSLNQSDYDGGFIPHVYLVDNSYLIYPLGDPNELLLNRALTEITGQAATGRERIETGEFLGEAFASSLDYNKRTGELSIDWRP